MEPNLDLIIKNLKYLVKVFPVSVYLTDYKGDCVFVNERWLDQAGLSREEINGRGWVNGIHEEDRERVQNAWYKMVAAKGTWGLEYRFKNKKTGKVTWVFGIASEIKDEQGNLISYIGVNNDITEEYQKMKFADEILNNVAEGVYLIGLDDGLIKYANPQFEKMFGYNRGELIGKSVSIVNDSSVNDPEEQARKIIAEIKKNGEWYGEIKNIRKDGTTFWCSANVSLFEHPQYGKVMISAHNDISYKKQTEEVFKSIFNSATEGILGADPETKNFVFANKRIIELLGYSEKELLNLGVLDIHPRESHELVKKEFKRLQTEDKTAVALPVLKKDGSIIYCDINGTIANIAGKNLMLGFFRDVTDRVKLEKRENEYREYVEKLNKVMIDREKKMIELKEKIKKMKN